MKLIKDRYFQERGRKAKIISVSSASCGRRLLIYQKDGPGWLKRCYLNRIISPKEYHNLLKSSFKNVKDLKNLECICKEIIGVPMRHKDGRIAFHLMRGKFKRANFIET